MFGGRFVSADDTAAAASVSVRRLFGSPGRPSFADAAAATGGGCVAQRPLAGWPILFVLPVTVDQGFYGSMRIVSQQQMEFGGKVVFVTGAASGIGRATALAFAGQGASVVAADLAEAANRETAELIVQRGGSAIAVRCDVTRGDQVKAALAATIERFGRLDFAVNNAGIEPRQPAAAADYDEDEWDLILDINLRGVFLCMKHEIPLILQQGGGAIVNLSSVAGVVGIRSSAAYTAAKHGVIGLTRAAALDYADQNLRINAVCPGYIETPMIDRAVGVGEAARSEVNAQQPTGRMGRPEEIASAILWMCSAGAGYLVGHALVVDGAMTTQ